MSCLLACLCLAVPIEGHTAVPDEVVVTAQQREKNLQAFPVAVTSFTGEEVKALGFQTQTDVFSQSVGASLSDFGTSKALRIRGLGPEVFSESIESSVAIYRDGVYRPTMAANSQQLFDVARVQVLRGPQGTQYGRNTNAGLVHIYSQRPTGELEGYAELQAGNYSQLIGEGAVSGGLTDALRGRLSMKYNKDDGYQKNLGSGGGRNYGETDVYDVRGQLELDITDDLNLHLIASNTRQRNTNIIYGFRGMVEEDGATPCAAAAVLDDRCYAAAPTESGVFRVEDLNAEEGYTELPDMDNDLDLKGVSATLDWAIAENLKLISITAYDELDRTLEEDADTTDFGLFSGLDPESGEPLFVQAAARYDLDAETLSQEFRLVGEWRRLDWFTGVYYYDDEKKDADSRIVDFGLDARADVDTDSIAAFGEFDFHLSEAWTLTAGLRYTDDERKAQVRTPLAPTLVPGAAEFAKFKVDDSDWTYLLGAQWIINDELMAYASHSTGVKSGEFNINLIALAEQAAPVGKEKIDAFELGFKWTFLEGMGRLNVSAFYNDVRDYQATVFELPPGGTMATAFFRNVGDVDIYGAEIDLGLAPSDRIDMRLGVTLLDTELDSKSEVIQGPLQPPDFSGGATYRLDGNELTAAPDVAVIGLFRYTLPTSKSMPLLKVSQIGP